MEVTTLNSIIGVSGVVLGAIIGAYATIISKKENPAYKSKNGNFETPLNDYIKMINFEKIKRILIIGHTGKFIVLNIIEQLNSLIKTDRINGDCKIHILLSAPNIEELDRNSQICFSINEISKLRKHILIDFRFYKKLPLIRGVICEYENKRESFLSAYYWDKQMNKTQSFSSGIIIKDSINKPNSLVKIAISWFEHFWSEDEIHTIVFDFDDTIIESSNIQINAWEEMVLTGKTIKENDYSEELKNALKTKNLKQTIKKIFFEEQESEKIFSRLYPNIDVQSELFKEYDKRRFELRNRNMNDVKFTEPCVKETLIELSQKYNLAIVSLTDEEKIIKPFLKREGLIEYFPLILGKRNLRITNQIDKVAKKTFLLLKLSDLIGIPLDRIIFVGDNHSDYLSAFQLNIGFIESRFIAKKNRLDSLIKNNENDHFDYKTIESFKYLTKTISEISGEIIKKKYLKLDVGEK